MCFFDRSIFGPSNLPIWFLFGSREDIGLIEFIIRVHGDRPDCKMDTAAHFIAKSSIYYIVKQWEARGTVKWR